MFYGADVAYIHDAEFGFLARGAADTLVRLLRRAGVRTGLVVDLACGSGITARRLTDAGYDVLGIDVSSDILALAQLNAPAARFERASLVDAELPACVAVCAIGEGLNYAADERAGREAAARVFGRAHEALDPGGLLLFDVAEPRREGGKRRRDWHEGEDWVLCLEAWEEPAERLLYRRLEIFRDTPRGWRRTHELHTLRLYTREEVLADLAAAGFDARLLRGYGSEYRFRRGHAGFAAVRRP